MPYQADAESGYGVYDPIADSEPLDYSGSRWRKPTWILGLVVCGVLGLGATSVRSIGTQSAYNTNQHMSGVNTVGCLQSSCNQAMAALAVQSDPASRELLQCLQTAGDGGSGARCFDEHEKVRTVPVASTRLEQCAICKQCIPGQISKKICDSLPQSYNDLRGPPPATEGGFGYSQSSNNNGYDYSRYMPAAFHPRAGTSFVDDDATTTSGVIPTDVMPAVADEVSGNLHRANDEVSAGLDHAEGLSPEKRAEIEHKVESELRRTDRKVSDELSHADDEILKADEKVSKEIDRADIPEAGREGIEEGIAEREAHFNPRLSISGDRPKARAGTGAWESRIGGTDTMWSKYLPNKNDQYGGVHGGDALEFIPSSYRHRT